MFKFLKSIINFFDLEEPQPFDLIQRFEEYIENVRKNDRKIKKD